MVIGFPAKVEKIWKKAFESKTDAKYADEMHISAYRYEDEL